MASESLVRAVATRSKALMEKADISHRYDHAVCVAQLCKEIGRREGADLELLTLAAYLHDVVPRNRSRGLPHHLASARYAESLLRSKGLSKKRSHAVRSIIEESSYEAFLSGCAPSSVEAKVLRDADFLEAMGARGIARAFAFIGWYRGTSLGVLDWDPEKPPDLKMAEVGPDPSAIWHFASKLLRLKNMMCTKTGVRLAQRRHAFMVRFLRRYASEMAAVR
jgi:uncharacterized protein